jgi:hypothetical protein
LGFPRVKAFICNANRFTYEFLSLKETGLHGQERFLNFLSHSALQRALLERLNLSSARPLGAVNLSAACCAGSYAGIPTAHDSIRDNGRVALRHLLFERTLRSFIWI